MMCDVECNLTYCVLCLPCSVLWDVQFTVLCCVMLNVLRVMYSIPSTL